MHLKKLIVLLVGFCVLLAPVLGNTALLTPAPAAHAHDQPDDCHSTNPEGGAHTADSKLSHNCCFNLVGTLSAINLAQLPHHAGEFIAFNPSLSLASRVEGLFRPPRQNS